MWRHDALHTVGEMLLAGPAAQPHDPGSQIRPGHEAALAGAAT
jgi:hypothetical protein